MHMPMYAPGQASPSYPCLCTSLPVLQSPCVSHLLSRSLHLFSCCALFWFRLPSSSIPVAVSRFRVPLFVAFSFTPQGASGGGAPTSQAIVPHPMSSGSGSVTVEVEVAQHLVGYVVVPFTPPAVPI